MTDWWLLSLYVWAINDVGKYFSKSNEPKSISAECQFFSPFGSITIEPIQLKFSKFDCDTHLTPHVSYDGSHNRDVG